MSQEISLPDAYRPDPAYLTLGDEAGAPFYDIVAPASFPDSVLRYRNDRAAATIGLHGLSDAEWIDHFARFRPLPDNIPAPIAIRYHGHQFRSYNPEIGDGRGFLYAQLRDGKNRLLDLGTKGSGQTPYSRFGDGRLTLKGAVREILATEMLEALGVYTSKTLSVIETGESLERNDEPSPTRSAVMVRLSHSHVRFGIFQRLGFEKDEAALNQLVDYCITNFYPDISEKTGTARVSSLFQRIVQESARLAAQWLAAGFVHGVLNTDNMNVTGESFDYGPWRFLPSVQFDFTAAYFDQTGIYAYGRQPDAVAWNLSRLGGVLSIIGQEAGLNEALQEFGPCFEKAMGDAFAKRLGVETSGAEMFPFVGQLLQVMQETKLPFERLFFDWFCGSASEQRALHSPYADIYQSDTFKEIRREILGFTPARTERLNHEYFTRDVPCTMLIEEVETLWASIARDDDWQPLNAKIDDIRAMGTAFAF